MHSATAEARLGRANGAPLYVRAVHRPVKPATHPLHDVTLLGAKQLTEEPRLWVEAAAAGLGLPEAQLAIWEAALRGLAAEEGAGLSVK